MSDQIEYAGFEASEFADNPEPRVPCVLLLDTSGSMTGQPITELMLYRLEAGRFASRLKARLPDEQRPSTPHGFLVGGLPLARRLLTMPPSRLR